MTEYKTVKTYKRDDPKSVAQPIYMQDVTYPEKLNEMRTFAQDIVKRYRSSEPHKNLLRIAARVMVVLGWTQGVSYRTKTGDVTNIQGEKGAVCSVCAVGAIGVARRLLADVSEDVLPQDTSCRAERALDRIVDLMPPVVRGYDATAMNDGGRIISYNDAPGRKPDEVLDVFRRALRVRKV